MTGGPETPTSMLSSTPTSVISSSRSQSSSRQDHQSVRDHERSAVQSPAQRIQARVMSQGTGNVVPAGTGPAQAGAGPVQAAPAAVGHAHGAAGGIVDLPLPGTEAAPR